MLAPSGVGNRSTEFIHAKVAAILSSHTELDSQLVLMSLEQAQALTKENIVSGIRLKLANIFDAPSTARSVAYSLGVGFYSGDWTRTHGNLYQSIQMSKNLVVLLVSLIVAIAALNVVSTLVMVVIDKNADIAILRTMGASSRDVLGIFLVLGSAIGLAGILLGILLGCALAWWAQDIVQGVESILGMQFLESDVYPLTYMPSEIVVADLLQIALIAFGMCFLATLYPAWRASRVKPAEALRYE